LTLTSLYLDEDGRNEYLRASGQEALSRELRGLSLITFLFKAANESVQEAIIDPAGTRLVSGFGPPLSPMSYAHLYVDLPRSSARHRVLKGLQGIAFDRPLIVPPGGSAEKVIFFRRPEQVGEEVNIVFGSLYLGGSQVGQATLSFRAFPLEE